MLRIALLIVILVCLYAGPVKGHNPIRPEPKGMDPLEQRHHRLHELKGHAWAMVKHPRSYRELVWHRKALRRINRALERTHRQLFLRKYQNSPIWAIHQVFGPYGDQAVEVARCETGGTFDTGATNGQYVNIFQMGYHERKTYGWHVAGSPAIVAARAAYRYFVASGRDWSPWECKP